MRVSVEERSPVSLRLRPGARYGLAALLTLAALTVRVVLDPLLGFTSPYLVTFVPVVFAALAWGWGAGITATVTGAAFIQLAFQPFLGTPALEALVTCALYLGVGVAISILGGQRKDALALAGQRANELEGHVQARTQSLAARTATLDEARARYEVLTRLGDALLTAQSANDIARLAVEPLAPFLRARTMLVILVRDEELHIPHVWGEVPDHMRTYFQPARRPLASAPVLSRLTATKESIYLSDYTVFPGVASDAPHLACAVEPILQPLGTLDGFLVCWRVVGPWSAVDRDLLQRAARTIGLALERAESLQRLEESSARLAELHAELTAYATGLSHDLIEPVRRIRGFSGLLERRFKDASDERAQRFFQIMRDDIQRVHGLAEDLTHFANAERKTMNVQIVSLMLLVGQVRSDLVLQQQGRYVRWVVCDLPNVLADVQMLRVALTNLLHNALKFTRNRDEAVISITADVNAREVVIHVRDNGVGFDMQDAERLFRVFGRLHPEFEGAGVGLANVRRIIARHGGEIRGEGVPGEGAVFSFTLPVAVNASLARSSTTTDGTH